MKLKVFTVYDAKVGAFMNPFYCRTSGEAERSFAAAVSDEKSNISRWPEDYTLFEVAEWDDQKATITMLDKPHSVCKAIQFVSQEVPKTV